MRAPTVIVFLALVGCGDISENQLNKLRAQKNTCELAGMAAVPMVDTSGRINYFKCEQKR